MLQGPCVIHGDTPTPLCLVFINTTQCFIWGLVRDLPSLHQGRGGQGHLYHRQLACCAVEHGIGWMHTCQFMDLTPVQHGLQGFVQEYLVTSVAYILYHVLTCSLMVSRDTLFCICTEYFIYSSVVTLL